MMHALTVLAIDLIQRVLQLRHIFGGAGIQSLLDRRLFGTRTSAKGLRPRRVGSQTGIDFDQPVGSGKPADEGVIELVNGRMLDGFLPNLHRRADRVKQIELTQLHSYGGQKSRWAKMVRRSCDRLVHGDAPSHESFFVSSLAMEHPSSFHKLFRACQPSLIWAKLR